MFCVSQRIGILAVMLGILSTPIFANDTTSPNGLALVIAQVEQQIAPSPLSDQDAGLISAALAKKGYAVTAARNLDAARLTSALNDFRATIKDNPNLPVFIYLGGQIIQSAQDNYLLPTDLTSLAPNDLKAKAVSINTFMAEIGQLTLAPKFFVMDGARLPFKATSMPATSSGMAIPKNLPRTSALLNQSPGMLAKDSEAIYRPFALAISEAIQNVSLPRDLADFVILRTFELSEGHQVPWAMIETENSGKIIHSENLPPALSQDLRSKPKSLLDAKQGFAAALIKSSVISYEEYNLIHIQNPMTNIARAILAALRDAQIWKEANVNPSAISYWSYLSIYPRGLHANEARAALKALGKPATPTPDEPLVSFATTQPSHDELMLLNQLTPYRLDEASTDLAVVANMIRQILPAIPSNLRNMPNAAPANSRYDLPLPPMDARVASQIQRPQSIPDTPNIKEPEVTTTKQQKKPAIPVPPRRLSDDVQSTPNEEPALITITIPVMTSQPAEAPAPAKSKQIKPITDFFEKPFDTSPEEQNLPY